MKNLIEISLKLLETKTKIPRWALIELGQTLEILLEDISINEKIWVRIETHKDIGALRLTKLQSSTMTEVCDTFQNSHHILITYWHSLNGSLMQELTHKSDHFLPGQNGIWVKF